MNQTFEFKLYRLKTALFGKKVDDQEEFRKSFSTKRTSQTITIGQIEMEMIADDLELDVEGVAYTASRYVNGRFRPKTKGLSGAVLGDFGEVIVYLLKKSDGIEITRVVSYQAAENQTIKDNRFPQPDFLTGSGSSLQALEVKSTQALDFQALQTVNHWKHLQPCNRVAHCKKEALPQLGYLNKKKVNLRHKLKLFGGKYVPFPVDAGEAVACLAIDGRLNSLILDKRYKTPPDCRKKERTCWKCIKSVHGFVVEMPNAPGFLALPGSDGYASGWHYAYRRWSQALWARDSFATEASLKLLMMKTVKWSETFPEDDKIELLAFWSSYLKGAMSTRGINIPLSEAFESSPEEASEAVDVPIVEKVDFVDLPRLVNSAKSSELPRYYSSAIGDSTSTATLSVVVLEEELIITLCSKFWWEESQELSEDQANETMSQLFRVANQLSGLPTDFVSPFRAVIAKVLVDTTTIQIGWHAEISSDFWYPSKYFRWGLQYHLLFRCFRMFVFPDGRARIKVRRL